MLLAGLMVLLVDDGHHEVTRLDTLVHLLGTALAHVIISPAAANREVSKRGVVLNDVIDRNDEGTARHREAHRVLTLHHQIIS